MITSHRSAGRFPGRSLTLGLIAAMAVAVMPASTVQPALAVSPDVVISQIYGGGGNSGAVLTHDYIELFNRGSSAVSLNGWSVQYASGQGTGNFGATNTQITELPDVSLQPGQYFLVQEASTAAVGAPLPTPDFIDATPIAMSATLGKVIVANIATSLGCNGVPNPCSASQLASIVDLVGYGSSFFYEGTGPTPVLSATVAAFRDNAGCTDTDDNAADFTAAAPAPRNTASPIHLCGLDEAPVVSSTTPSNGAVGVDKSASISITFSEAVSLTDPWFTIECTSSGSHSAGVSGGPGTYTLDPDTDFTGGETCTVTVMATGVTDADVLDPPDTMVADYVFSFSIALGCGDAFTPIPVIQGSGAAAAITGIVSTEGVVVGDFEGPSTNPQTFLRGYYIQDPVGDGDPATSDAIFVFNASNATAVALGDNVRVTGTAAEFQDQTQITQSSVIQCSTAATVSPTDVTFPVASPTALEAYEGMLVRLPQTMYVTEHFQLGRFGQVVLSSGDRLQVPTAVVDPGAPALALQAANNLNRIILDDSSQAQNPDPIRFARGGLPLSASNTLRGGDTATGIVGVMTYTWAGNSASGNAYRVRPFNALGGSALFEATNPRPGDSVDVDGTTRVVGMNLLNYFNTFDGLPDPAGNDNCAFGVGGAPADCRGADTQTEFDRQWPKTVAAIVGLDADVIGVNEIENDGYGPESAIADLVDRLNTATAPGTYAFIDVDAATGQLNAAGTDAIKVGIIYKPAVVSPVGTTAALNTVAFVNGGDDAPRSRPSIAQAFETLDGARFIVDVNHLKSKGSACNDPDAGDGQGNCNIVRTNAANELATWLASDPTGTGDDDILIVGDLNSYAKEDPIVALEGAGFTNLVDTFVEDPYSYVFDGQWGYLDYALGSASAVTQVAGIVEWHINSDEPSVLDYNTDFKTANLIDALYAADRFRVSDHDPIVVGLNANSDRPIVDANGPYQVIEGGTVQLTATGSDPTGDAITFAWDFDGDGFDDGVGATVTFDAAALQAPQTVTVTVKVTDEHGQFSTDTATIDVIWDFDGFFGPVAGRPTVEAAQAGATIPIKFSLNGDQGLLVLADGYPTTAEYTCGTEPPDDAATPVEASTLQYDPVTDEYTFLWRTDKAWAGTCRTFVLGLADGTKHYVDVHFRAETSSSNTHPR